MRKNPKYKIQGNSIVETEEYQLKDSHAFKKIACIVAGSAIIGAAESFCNIKGILPSQGLEPLVLLLSPIAAGGVIGKSILSKYAASKNYNRNVSSKEPDKADGILEGLLASSVGMSIGYIAPLIWYLLK